MWLLQCIFFKKVLVFTSKPSTQTATVILGHLLKLICLLALQGATQRVLSHFKCVSGMFGERSCNKRTQQRAMLKGRQQLKSYGNLDGSTSLPTGLCSRVFYRSPSPLSLYCCHMTTSTPLSIIPHQYLMPNRSAQKVLFIPVWLNCLTLILWMDFPSSRDWAHTVTTPLL